jgi:hypothetical protein
MYEKGRKEKYRKVRDQKNKIERKIDKHGFHRRKKGRKEYTERKNLEKMLKKYMSKDIHIDVFDRQGKNFI